jgi:hypothetical protein
VQRRSFGAQAPEIGRMIRVTSNANDRPAIRLDNNAATNSAIAARGSDFLHRSSAVTSLLSKLQSIFTLPLRSMSYGVSLQTHAVSVTNESA